MKARRRAPKFKARYIAYVLAAVVLLAAFVASLVKLPVDGKTQGVVWLIAFAGLVTVLARWGQRRR